MSKSLGNIIPAGKAMQDLGADVLRLYVSAADYRNEISASDEIFKRTADAYRRIRNTARFLLANLAGFDPVTDCLPVEQLLPLDRWILGQAQALQAGWVCAAEGRWVRVGREDTGSFLEPLLGVGGGSRTTPNSIPIASRSRSFQSFRSRSWRSALPGRRRKASKLELFTALVKEL